MRRSLAVVPLALLALANLVAAGLMAQPASAQSIEAFMKAPVWYLEYEVSVRSSYEGSHDGIWGGTMSFKITLDQSFSGSTTLDVRSQGPGTLSMMGLFGSSPDGTALTAAKQQELMALIYTRFDELANWMPGGAGGPEIPEDVSLEELSAMAMGQLDAAQGGPGRLEYLRVDHGDNLPNEMGDKYSLTVRKTRVAQGRVLSGGIGSITLELDAAAKRYLLSFPVHCDDPSLRLVREETVETTQFPGEPPSEVRTSSEFALKMPNDLTLDEAVGHPVGGVVVSGDLEPSTGKIAGERSFKVHFNDQNDTVPGTLTVRYTLTRTPPTKTASAG